MENRLPRAWGALLKLNNEETAWLYYASDKSDPCLAVRLSNMHR